MGKSFLLVTASIGSGHEKAASAIAEGIQAYFPDARIDTVDFMRWDTSFINAFMKSCYLKMLALVPNLYEFMYRFTDGNRKGGFIQLLMAQAMSRSIKRLVRKYRPDVIICTHPFPAEAVSHLGDSWRQQFVSVAVITDYSVHRMWICPNMDLYFVGCDLMKKQLIADGIREDTIHVTGIPVSRDFYQAWDKAACRQAAGLSQDLPVVLLMGGGLGLGRIVAALEQLEKLEPRLQLLVAAGRNHELKAQAERFGGNSHHCVHVYGFTDKVCQLMGASDILVTKPGALTLTEAMAMGLPMVLHEPIPGPETDNARYMSGCGAAVWLHAGDNLACVIRDLLSEQYALSDMAMAARRHARPGTVQDIARAIEELL